MTKSPLGESATDHDICLCKCELIDVLIKLPISEVGTDNTICLSQFIQHKKGKTP